MPICKEVLKTFGLLVIVAVMAYVAPIKKAYNDPESEDDDSGNDSNEEIDREIRGLNGQDG